MLYLFLFQVVKENGAICHTAVEARGIGPAWEIIEKTYPESHSSWVNNLHSGIELDLVAGGYEKALSLDGVTLNVYKNLNGDDYYIMLNGRCVLYAATMPEMLRWLMSHNRFV